VAASPGSVESECGPTPSNILIVRYNVNIDSETEKRSATLVSTMVLSEPRRLLLFQVVRGGIECQFWISASAMDHSSL
jgi:hypothetical protein